MKISQFLIDDHKKCDDNFLVLENAVTNEKWEKASELFDKFIESMEIHFKMEEDILFPQFESITGSTMGPTEIMRMEHSQMREIFQEMKDAIQNKNKNEFFNASETLLIILQQHNLKEENILYNMLDQMLPNSEEIINELKSLQKE